MKTKLSTIMLIFVCLGQSSITYATCGSGDCNWRTTSVCCNNLADGTCAQSCASSVLAQPCGNCVSCICCPEATCIDGNECCDLTCCDNKTVYGKTHFSPRSQSRSTIRLLSLSHPLTYEYRNDSDYCFATFRVFTEFTQSFKPNGMAIFLLPTCCNAITLGPDKADLQEPCLEACPAVTVRGQDFGLSPSFQATACLSPQISNYIADLSFYFDTLESDCWYNGIFGYLDVPIVNTRWSTNCSFFGCDFADTTFPECLMANPTIEDGLLIDEPVGTTSIEQALVGDFRFGAEPHKQCFGIICPEQHTLSHTGIADVRFALGYMFFARDWWRFGIKFVGAAPTGNSAQGHYLFEPIVGNGKYWEAGAGFVGQVMVWDNDCGTINFATDGEITHMFTSKCQTRLFDLKNNGPWSRYLLLKKFDNEGTVLCGLERGPNLFAQDVKIKIDVQADISAMLTYQNKNVFVDGGYNFWYRSREKITKLYCCIPENRFGIKGTVPFCQEIDGETTENLQTASLSTITESKGTAGLTDGPDPVFVSCADLDICSAQNPAAWSHTVFFNVGYIVDIPRTPYFGFGGKAEFSGKGNRALNQWGIWLMGSVAI